MLYKNRDDLWYETSLDIQATPTVRVSQETVDGKLTDTVCVSVYREGGYFDPVAVMQHGEALVLLARRAIALGKAVARGLAPAQVKK